MNHHIFSLFLGWGQPSLEQGWIQLFLNVIYILLPKITAEKIHYIFLECCNLKPHCIHSQPPLAPPPSCFMCNFVWFFSSVWFPNVCFILHTAKSTFSRPAPVGSQQTAVMVAMGLIQWIAMLTGKSCKARTNGNGFPADRNQLVCG